MARFGTVLSTLATLFALTSAAGCTDAGSCPEGGVGKTSSVHGQGSFDNDVVSLLSIKTKISRSKDEVAATTDSDQKQSAQDDSTRTKCKTAKCNPGTCGKVEASTGAVAEVDTTKTDASQGIREIQGVFCQAAFGQDKCCQERYTDGTVFLRKSYSKSNLADACNSCQNINTNVAGPVTLYVMRHAEGCHNMETSGIGQRSHTHKVFGKKDAPLTDQGMAQAALARPTFAGLGNEDDFDEDDWRVLVSPMRRAQQTLSVALHATAFAGKTAQVTPYANERGSSNYLPLGPENKPTTPAIQKCLMDHDDAALIMYHGADNIPDPVPAHNGWQDIDRCMDYPWAARDDVDAFSISTCTENNAAYNAAAKLTSPQDFADFIMSRYGHAGRVANVILAGHSNWAKDAGLFTNELDENGDPVFQSTMATHDTEGNPIYKKDKVNWASVYKVQLVPGNDVKQDTKNAEELYIGTAREAGTEGNVEDDARCQADVGLHDDCT